MIKEKAPTHDLQLETVIRMVVKSILSNEVHTSIPGRIETYDYTKCKENVKPMIARKNLDGTTTSLPIITNCPVIWPRTSKGGIHIPLNAGDGVSIFFADRSIEDWLYGTGEISPEDTRAFDYNDAFIIPGMFQFTQDSPFDNNNNVQIKSNTLIELGDNVKKLINETFIELFNAHVHTGGTISGSTDVPTVLFGNTPPQVPVTFLTTKVGAE
jgi:hypothetical protein